MKVAILVLFAMVAVSQAAFTKSLVQQTQPILSQAVFRMRMSTTRANADIKNQFLDAFQTVVSNVVSQIQQAVESYEVIVQTVSENIQALYEQLSGLGAEFIQAGSAAIQNFINNHLSGIFGTKSIDGAAIMSFLQSIGIDNILSFVSTQIHNLIESLNLGSVIEQVLTLVLGEDHANAIISHFTTKLGRGFWDSIVGGLGDAWNFVTDGVSNAWDWVSGGVVDGFNWFVSILPSLGSIALEHVQSIATEFVQNAALQAALAAGPHVVSFVEWLSPHAVMLGDLYTQVMAIINGFNKGLKLVH